MNEETVLDEKIAFNRLRLGDKVYVLNLSEPIPKIEIEEITSISLQVNGFLNLAEGKHRSSICTIPEKFVDKTIVRLNKSLFIFTNKKECTKKLEEICIQRITELLKITKRNMIICPY